MTTELTRRFFLCASAIGGAAVLVGTKAGHAAADTPASVPRHTDGPRPHFGQTRFTPPAALRSFAIDYINE
ncbi:MAG: hypothetical protein K9M45_07750 [Kiritimatiellales bacterium]|nr:hypothetical protein [Kiritimatiellales bacterium]